MNEPFRDKILVGDNGGVLCVGGWMAAASSDKSPPFS